MSQNGRRLTIPPSGAMADVNPAPILPPLSSIYPLSPDPDLSFLTSEEAGSYPPSPFYLSSPLPVIQLKRPDCASVIRRGDATGNQREARTEWGDAIRDAKSARIRSLLSKVLNLREENDALKEKLQGLERGGGPGEVKPTANHQIQTDQLQEPQHNKELEILTRTASALESAQYELLEKVDAISDSVSILSTGHCDFRLAFENLFKKMEEWKNEVLGNPNPTPTTTRSNEGNQEDDGIQLAPHVPGGPAPSTVAVANNADRPVMPVEGGSSQSQPLEMTVIPNEPSLEVPGSGRKKRAAATAALEFMNQLRVQEANDDFIIEKHAKRVASAKKKKMHGEGTHS